MKDRLKPRRLAGYVAMPSLLLVLFVVSGLRGQEIIRPTGRRISGLVALTPTPTTTPTPTITPTITPTPDPCDECPEPGGTICEMWPEACYACWEDCGSPIATHTPTYTPTLVATYTPTPTPTPQGPACPLILPTGGTVYLVAFYLHTIDDDTRYSYQTLSIVVPPGMTARPCRPPCEGIPVGFKWFNGSGVLLKSCGDTIKNLDIFKDGFESGDWGEWK